MNRMDAEEVLFISFFEEGKEEGQDQKNTKKTSFRLSTKQGLFIFYSIPFIISFMHLWSTGCTSSGAISVKGSMTNAR